MFNSCTHKLKKLLLSSLWLCFIALLHGNALAQPTDSTLLNSAAANISSAYVVVQDIIVIGNKKTKTNIITRELLFKKNDTIASTQLSKKINQSKQLVFNTSLFVSVDIITAKSNGNNITLIVDVKERWYIFPLPYFKLIDRNFNEWWVNQNRDLERTTYGIKVYHNNLTGRNDPLNIALIGGYSQQVSFKYVRPFIDNKLKHGLAFSYNYATQRNINYKTDSLNTQQFITLSSAARKINRALVEYSYRPNQYIKHGVAVSYNAEQLHDSISKLNYNFYGDGANSFRNTDIAYSVSYAKTNYNAYPTKGLILGASVAYRHNYTNQAASFAQLGLSSLYAIPLGKNGYFRNENNATVKLNNSENIYYNMSLFGYGRFQMRGLELNVIEGNSAALSAFTFGYKFLDFKVKLPVKSRTHQYIPFKVYAKAYGDVGYCYTPFNPKDLLSNKLLKTWGLGLDVLSIYDFVLRVEYSFNQIGYHGFVVETK